MQKETTLKAMRDILLKFFVLMIFAVGATTEALAQYTYKFRDTLGTYEVRFTPASKHSRFTQSRTKPLLPHTHELRLATSFGGTTWDGGVAQGYDVSYHGESLNRPTYEGPSHHYTLTLDYGYWVNEWLSVGASATYMAGLCNLFDSHTHERVMTVHDDNISIMPLVRMAWYRRGIVQLYSSIGIGVGVNLWERFFDGRELMHDVYCAFDLKPLGVAVGRKCFGFVEIGYGSRGVINAGFGVRINNKVR